MPVSTAVFSLLTATKVTFDILWRKLTEYVKGFQMGFLLFIRSGFSLSLSLPTPSHITFKPECVPLSFPDPPFLHFIPHKQVFPCSVFAASPGPPVIPVDTLSISSSFRGVKLRTHSSSENTNKFWEMLSHLFMIFHSFHLLWEKLDICSSPPDYNREKTTHDFPYAGVA